MVKCFSAIAGGALAASVSHAAETLPELTGRAWSLAEARSVRTANWLQTTYGSPAMFSHYPHTGNIATGNWQVSNNTGNWRTGFWPGTLWLLAQRTGGGVWKQQAEDWSAALANTTNSDHDIGFITMASLGKGWLYHDDLTDPGGAYRALAATALTAAAAKLDSRFNRPNSSGTAIPAGFIRSWNTPFQDPYPVCVDNLMNLELMFLAYEINGRMPSQRVWFDHALTHARNSISRLLRPDGGTYHVVRHFESGPLIGRIERKCTLQGYGDETTWSRGQAWAIYGFTAAYRHASRDPGTDASDLLDAARATAGYFLDHLPHYHTADIHNHRIGDFVPPSDFNAALGEPAGPWNDANGDYNPTTGAGLGDRMPPTMSFAARDTSAAAIAASALIELSGLVSPPAERARYLKGAEDILRCLITYDGPDQDTSPDYLCAAGESAHPGILKAGRVRWNDPNQSLIYGDYYLLEALARHDALTTRAMLETTKRAAPPGPAASFSFEIPSPSPALALRVQTSPDLAATNWTTVAGKIGASPWSGSAGISEEILPGNRVRVVISISPPGERGFFRVLTRSAGGGAP
jgi:unsaturated chondroitin disaccharide hydrolase